VSIRLLNCHTRNPSRSCISRSTSQSHSLSDSISQRASLFTYHLVRAGYSPVPSSRFTLIIPKTLVTSPTDYASSGSGSEHRTVTYAELATDPTQLKSSRTCHRHVTHSLSDSISQRASLFTYHLVRAGYSPVLSPRFTLITPKTLVSSPTNSDSSGSGSERRTVTFAELVTDPPQLTSSRTCHRHVTKEVSAL
jgi:hypothetical protein